MPNINGILLVAFGISTKVAQDTLLFFERCVQSCYPNTTIRWAYTSTFVRERMEKLNIKALSVKEALADMASEEYKFIAVQSLHIIRGSEYEDLLQDVNDSVRKHSIQVRVGAPLLSSKEDIELVAKSLFSIIPKERKKNEAVLFMGHGTKHEGNKAYELLAEHFFEIDPFTYIGTLESNPTLKDLLPIFHKKGIKHVWLLPLLSIIGKHAQKDMLGKKNTSWQSTLCNEGYTCTPIAKGIAEYPGICALWVAHLAQAVESLPTSTFR